MRDDFSTETKDLLAKRVGFRCSNPNCRKPTSGPQTNPEKAINIGVASHITAASPGGKRYDSNLSQLERKSHLNGIWLCQTCGKLVDNDDIRYTIELLNKWKNLSEQAALLDIETNNQNTNVSDNTNIISINQSGGQVAKTIINKKPIRRSIKSQKGLLTYYLKQTQPVPYEIHILMNDLESADLAAELKELMIEAGWQTGPIIKGLGGYYPAGVTLTRNKESIQSDIILEALFRIGLKNVTGEAAFQGDKIKIHIGPNPDNYM